jgi:hypothetical protein
VGGRAASVSRRGSSEREKKGRPHTRRRETTHLSFTHLLLFTRLPLCFSFVTSKLQGGGEKKDTQKKPPLTQKNKMLYPQKKKKKVKKKDY